MILIYSCWEEGKEARGKGRILSKYIVRMYEKFIVKPIF
jgi:hypothetical protein